MAIPTNLSVAAVSYNGTGIPLVGIVPSGTTQVNVTSNGTTTQDVTNYAYVQVNASVPNTYAAADEGKVVSNGALVAQTSKNISANGTVDTTLNNQVVVAVPNSYSASDDGKVVSNGALVAQGSDTVTVNDTYDTTLINSLTVNVSGSGGGGATLLATETVSGQNGKQININSSWLDTYDMVVIVPDITLSALDWLYVQHDATTNGSYTDRLTAYGDTYKAIITKLPTNNSMFAFVLNNRNPGYFSWAVSSYIYYYAYTSSTTITGTFKVYGLTI